MPNVIVQANVGKIKQSKIYAILRTLKQLPKVEVQKEDDYSSIKICHDQQYVPDFEFVWCPNKKHYRVYILVASVGQQKTRAGYCIFTVGTSLTAMGFGTLYQFIHKNRANNKEQAE